MPGVAGGYIFVRDAVKKALPKDAPSPGKFRVVSADVAPAAEAAPAATVEG